MIVSGNYSDIQKMAVKWKGILNMVCNKCGTTNSDDRNFCTKCGAYIADAEKTAINIGVSILSIIETIIGIGIVLGILYFVFFRNSPVNSIKESYLSSYSESVTIGDAFDEFFSHPKWESGVDENGRKVVNFYGGCLYYDEEIDVTVQFLFSSDESQFEVYAVEFNDIPQNIFVINGLLETVYEDYAS